MYILLVLLLFIVVSIHYIISWLLAVLLYTQTKTTTTITEIEINHMLIINIHGFVLNSTIRFYK